MSSEIATKLNLLMHRWPAGTVAVQPWLEKQGVYQQLARRYEESGWIRKVGRGAYARLSDNVDWTGALYPIQTQLKLPVHAGAKTALELKGFGHFIAAGKGARAYLFGRHGQRLPSWFAKHPWERKIRYFVPRLFRGDPSLGLTTHSFRTYEIKISTPERAILEALHLTPTEQSVEESFHLMEGLTALRPDLVTQLLKACRSVKVKRLFLALAEKCHHSWVAKVHVSKASLGKGKRAITRGGRLDKKYLVTLPDLGESSEGSAE